MSAWPCAKLEMKVMISWMLKPDVSLSILSPEEVEEGIDVVFVARFRPSMPSSIRSIMYGKKGLDEARSKESKLTIRTLPSPRGAMEPR